MQTNFEDWLKDHPDKSIDDFRKALLDKFNDASDTVAKDITQQYIEEIEQIEEDIKDYLSDEIQLRQDIKQYLNLQETMEHGNGRRTFLLQGKTQDGFDLRIQTPDDVESFHTLLLYLTLVYKQRYCINERSN